VPIYFAPWRCDARSLALARTFAGMRRIASLMFSILETAAMQKLTFIAQVLASEYADHPPLYRQAQI